ncbi:nucleoside triphosphate pyrophosphohydrolase family protein [Candidatus Berkelbacteria bacterium]|nr:nucleoside triphosphate pyrophosphohydrolase family protein [Candidatus Berkelbacteria bacterium]
MKEQLLLVEEFHRKYQNLVSDSPTALPDSRFEFRYRLMAEEVDEYLKAAQDQDLAGIAKELSDILYTVYGTIIEHGLQKKIDQVFKEVHRSNMSKDIGPDKAIKGSSYFEPRLRDILD